MRRSLGKPISSPLLASVLAIALVSCQKPQPSPPAQLFPPPAATGSDVATVDCAVPAGNENRTIFAGLKRDGRVVARGEAIAPASGSVRLSLRALDAAKAAPDGDYELWLTVDRDGLQSCFPSFGDLYVLDKWNLSGTTRAKTVAASLWKEKRLSKPDNLVTIHYHRYDDDYDNVGIWTWDGYHQRTPEPNEFFEVGRDDFGLVFQLDRGEYGEKGGSDKIGLLPRLAGDWNRRDGDDKFWRANMNNKLYLMGTENRAWTKRPDTGPRVVGAYIDARDRLVLKVSRLVGEAQVPLDSFKITDDKNNSRAPSSARLLPAEGKKKNNFIELTVTSPLDIGARTYRVAMQGFAGEAAAVPRGVLDEPDLFCDHDAVLGATCSPTGTTFRVFAPTAQAVHVVLYDKADGDRGRTAHPLQRAAKGIWDGTLPGDLQGKYYVYSLDGQDLSPDREVVDIYSVNTVNNTTRSRITNLESTNPPGWQQAKAGPALASPVDMIVYEMHVRDFTIAASSGADHKGRYLGFAQSGTHLPDDPATKTGLDHLAELGITHVQLMPVQDFDNDESTNSYSWGYATSAYNSPEGWFATNLTNDSRVREFKQLVQALHQRGIGVIMDVVYNHTASNAPFNSLVPSYYFRLLPDGSYANGSGCGNEFRTESPMGRKYVIDTLKYWVEEYGVDGFRFDLMALIDLDTMKEAERVLRRIKPDIVLYGEPWAAGTSPLKQQTNKQSIRGTHIGAFNNNLRDAMVGSPFDKTHAGFVQDGSNRDDVKRCVEGSWRDWADQPTQAINYLSCHDNYVVYDKLKLTKPKATEQELKDMMKLGYLLLFTAQGVPFLHGGEEFARTKQGHENSYNAPDEINQVDWSLKKKNYDLFTYTRDLIALRKAHPVFRIRAKEQIAAWMKFHDTTDPSLLMFTIDAGNVESETWKRVCVIVNSADVISTDVSLPPGTWHVAFDKNGAADNHPVEGTVRVRYKSGMILYQP